MPSLGEKGKLKRVLDKNIQFQQLCAVIESSSSDEEDGTDDFESSSDDDVGILLEVKRTVLSKRYLSFRNALPKSREFVQKLLPVLDDARFRSEVRMSKESLFFVHDLIRDHAVFQNNSRCQQKPVELQLLVALFRFGHYGNAASTGKIATKFGISEGAVDLYTYRIISALLSLMPRYLKWPDDEQKLQIKKKIFAKHGFPDCVGLADGTLVVLDKCPALNGEDYYSRKKLYGLSALVVCNDNRTILYAFTGFPGSAHDSRVYANSSLPTNPEKYFAPEEYLLTDSGYPCSTHIIPAYKAPHTNLRENSEFNTFLAEARVPNEHVIGVVKGRFQSLRGLRICIKDKASRTRAVHWFLACCVLHNVLQEMLDPIDDDWIVPEIPNDLIDLVLEHNLDAGKQRREEIKRIVLLCNRNK